MTQKIYLNPKKVEVNTAKLDFLMEALDIELDAGVDLEIKDIYSPLTDEEVMDDIVFGD